MISNINKLDNRTINDTCYIICNYIVTPGGWKFELGRQAVDPCGSVLWFWLDFCSLSRICFVKYRA